MKVKHVIEDLQKQNPEDECRFDELELTINVASAPEIQDKFVYFMGILAIVILTAFTLFGIVITFTHPELWK